MAKIFAAGFLLSALAAAQDAEKREPPYRLDFDRVALEKQGDELRLSIRATSNLPRETTLDFSISPIVERYDRAKKTIARQPLDPPLLRKIRAEGTTGGKVEFTAVEPFPRDGEIRIEASFRPDRLFDPEREPIKKSMGERFVPMKWEKTVTIGTPASRLAAMSSGYQAVVARIAEAEKLVKRLDQLSGNNEETIAEACGEVNALRTKMERALAETPCPAGVDFLWQALGDMASWGAYKAVIAAAARKSKGPSASDPDGGQKKPPPKDAPSFEKYNADLFTKTLQRGREILVREYALAGAAELRRAHDEAAAAFRSEKPAKLSADAVKSAVQKHHHLGISKLGEPYAHLFAAGAGEPFEAALKRLDLLQLATADELEKHGKELDAMTAAWRHLEK